MLIVKDDGLDVWKYLITSGDVCDDGGFDEIHWGDVDEVFSRGRGSLIATVKDVTDLVDKIVGCYFCCWVDYPDCYRNRKLTIKYETI